MNRHILVVDDDWLTRSMLQEFLEEEAYEVDTASDGLIAWEKLARSPEKYRVILLDLTMPRMDGLQLIRVLRQQEEAWLRQIVVLSGDHNAIQQAVEMGISHALAKPLNLEEVLVMLSNSPS